MNIKPTAYAAAVLASLLVPALSVTAFAQNETPGGVLTNKRAAHIPKPAAVTDQVEEHITKLHTELKITPAQQPQWDPFAQVMRDNARDMDQSLQQRGTTLATMSAVDDMQSYAQVAQQHAQDMQKLSAAFQTLYASMSDDQKKNADMVFRARVAQAKHSKS
jgi:Skp family chaperone for outer membrane proteins